MPLGFDGWIGKLLNHLQPYRADQLTVPFDEPSTPDRVGRESGAHPSPAPIEELLLGFDIRRARRPKLESQARQRVRIRLRSTTNDGRDRQLHEPSRGV